MYDEELRDDNGDLGQKIFFLFFAVLQKILHCGSHSLWRRREKKGLLFFASFRSNPILLRAVSTGLYIMGSSFFHQFMNGAEHLFVDTLSIYCAAGFFERGIIIDGEE